MLLLRASSLLSLISLSSPATFEFSALSSIREYTKGGVDGLSNLVNRNIASS